MINKIILTNKDNTTTSGKQFPKTPDPEIRYDGVFPTKQMILDNFKNKLKRHLASLILFAIIVIIVLVVII